MQKKQKNKKKKGPKKLHPFLGGLENGLEVVPPFSQKRGFSKSSETLFLLCFPKKWVAVSPFKKAYVTRRTLLEGQKNGDFLGSFRQKSLRSHKKGGLGGGVPPQ